MKKFLKTPFQLGKKLLPNNIFYAPLAGCSDYPFRLMSAAYRPGLIYCEMVKMDALVRNDSGTFHILDYDVSMHPIGAQLCGSKPELAGKAARILEDLGFDVIDLNCGCPVDKVTKDGSGSGLLKNPELIGEILSNITAAVKVPVTVKIRAGWDEETIYAAKITEIAEQAGADAICIHARTRKQAYRGPANWEWIRQAKESAKTIKVIGNGDVLDGPSAEKMFKETGCDAVLVARGSLGQPWIVQEIMAYLEGNPFDVHTVEDHRQALLKHFQHTLAYQGDKRTAVDMRRVGCWYLKKSAGTRHFREQISRAENIAFIKELIETFPLEDAAGLHDEDQSEDQNECC